MTNEDAINALRMCQDLMLFDPLTGETHELWEENKDNQNLYNACGVAIITLREQAERKHAVDAVEVVFCKDCQYRETTNCITPDLVNDDDYCSYGKRRESEVSE